MNFHLKLASNLTKLLDSQFQIFGWKFGLDPILGIFPIFGDIFSVMLSLYTVWIAKQYGLPQAKINRMIFNIVFDFAIGLFPVVGDLYDFVFKSNTKNLKILQDYLTQQRLNTHRIVDGEIVAG